MSTGQRVLITGLLGGGTLRVRLRTAGLQPWRGRVPRPERMVIRSDSVTGRRL